MSSCTSTHQPADKLSAGPGGGVNYFNDFM